jgi:site-specific recombinase XerD
MSEDLHRFPIPGSDSKFQDLELPVDFAVPGGKQRSRERAVPAAESSLLQLHRRFRRYCAVEEGLRPRTVAMLESCMKTFVNRSHVQGLHEVTLEVLQDFFYEGRERRQWSYWHYANHHKYLRKFLDWCVSRGHLKENPILGIKKPPKPQSLPRRLSYAEAQAVLYASFNHKWRYSFERARNHAMIATLLYTGLRAAELLALHVIDLSPESGTLLVRAGKGGKDRYVPVHRKLRYILKQYLQDRQRLGKTTPYLFTSSTRDQPIAYKTLGKICRTLSKATGVRFTPHCLRHTFGSVAIEQQMGLVQLKEIMGHSSISSTMLYLRMSPQGLRESLDRIDLF